MIGNLKIRPNPIMLYWLFILASPFQLSWAKAAYSEECDRGRFALQAEYIYFQPFFDNDFVAAPNISAEMPFNLQPGGPGKKNKFDYTSGYRLSAWYIRPNTFNWVENGCLRLTYLPARHSKKIGLGSFLSTLAASPTTEAEDLQLAETPGFLTSNHRLDYYAADLFVTCPVFDICPFKLSVQPGLHYAFMQYKTHVHFSTKNNPLLNHADLKEKSQTGGLGPQLGFKLNYQFCNWLSLNAGLRGGLLISRAKAQFRINPYQAAENLNASESNDSQSSVFHPKTRWKTFPFWETNIGLCASFCTYGYLWEVEIGYEYLTYPNFINRIQFPSNGSRSADNIFTTFDFQGPYASLTIVF